jgi:hypothetical protein
LPVRLGRDCGIKSKDIIICNELKTLEYIWSRASCLFVQLLGECWRQEGGGASGSGKVFAHGMNLGQIVRTLLHMGNFLHWSVTDTLHIFKNLCQRVRRMLVCRLLALCLRCFVTRTSSSRDRDPAGDRCSESERMPN